MFPNHTHSFLTVITCFYPSLTILNLLLTFLTHFECLYLFLTNMNPTHLFSSVITCFVESPSIVWNAPESLNLLLNICTCFCTWFILFSTSFVRSLRLVFGHYLMIIMHFQSLEHVLIKYWATSHLVQSFSVVFWPSGYLCIFFKKAGMVWYWQYCKFMLGYISPLQQGRANIFGPQPYEGRARSPKSVLFPNNMYV